MNLSEIKRVAVIGAGDMGHGIAEACAIAGYEVALRDIKEEYLEHAVERIKKSLKILARKRKVKRGQVGEIVGRIRTFVNLAESAQGAQLVIEAVPEIMDLKQSVLRELDAALSPEAIIATNTSNMSISALGAVTSRPAKVAGLHFFNPAILMKTVEIIPGSETTAETMGALKQFVGSLGKIPVAVKKDSPGFIINRVQVAAQVLIGRAVDLGIATPEEIDAVSRKMGVPMGPFETMDFVGLDVVYHGMDYFGKELGPEYGPPEWLANLFEEGQLGKKTGKGIFDWSSGRPEIDVEKATDKVSLLDLMAVQTNEATKLLEEGVVENAEDIDVAIKNGTGNSMGVLGLLKSVGKEKILGICQQFAEELDLKVFQPTKTLKDY